MQAYTSPRRTFGFFGDNRLIIWSLGVVVIAAIILTGFFYNRNEVSIHADGKATKLVMRGGTVADALKKAQITVGEKDIVSPPLDTPIKTEGKVTVIRMIKFTLLADNQKIDSWAPPGTVEQALKSLNVSLNPGDEVVPPLKTEISPNQTIQIARHSTEIINQSIKIPYKVERKQDSSLESGSKKVVREGQNGTLQRTLKITYKDGKEIKREIVGEKTTQPAINKVVAFGTMRSKVVSRGESIKFSRSVRMNSTAYTHTGNRTASGVYPHKGAVAVDPRVIPLGTKLYVEGYGYARALDIGSSIKGNKIDVFFDTAGQALRWGRRTVTVYILK